ncbi:MAG: PQQ-binding-like beta-propeller repeat protein [Thermoplasmata archaeon]|nr:PQQ-binding-like beta-propeller repeat protein [Thermoplasmata archaeon]
MATEHGRSLRRRSTFVRSLLVIGTGVLLALLVPPNSLAHASAAGSSPGLGLHPLGATAPTVAASRSLNLSGPTATSSSFKSGPGDTVVVFFSVFGMNRISLTDSSHDTFTSLLNVSQSTPKGANSFWVFAAFNVSKATTKTLTATLSGSSIDSAVGDIDDVTGVGPAPLDVLGAPTNYSTAKDPRNASTSLVASALDLVLSSVGAHDTRTWSATSTDTLLTNAHSAVPGAEMTAAAFSHVAGASGTVWMNATANKGATYWIDGALALKPPSSPVTGSTVTFTESGLPAGHPWYVRLGGALNSSKTSQIGFSEPNGSFAFAVGAISGFTATPGSGLVTVSGSTQSVPISFPPDTDDWPTYLGEVTRDAANYNETALSSATAPNLTELWSSPTGNIQSESVVLNETLYVGGLNGYEYAINASTGAQLWKTYTGQVLQPGCVPFPAGITSSATVAGGMVYVGGGNLSGTGNVSTGYTGWYALNASTGAIAWTVPIGRITQGSYNWASPLIADGYAYIGNASRCDKPLVWGGLIQVSLTSHTVVGFFNTTRGDHNVRGASIWGSPTYDRGNNTVFFADGNPLHNHTSTYSESVVAINATTLAPLGSWQVPLYQTVKDSDFGTTPTYLHLPGGEPLVVAMNKNGIVYALNASSLSAGPVWETNVSYSVNPQNVAPLAWGGGLLYGGSGPTNISGKDYLGGLHVFYPGNGTIKWQKGFTGDVYGAPVYANGIVAAAGGRTLQVFNSTTGTLLWKWTCGKMFSSAPTIAEGRIYVGCNATYAFGLTGIAAGPALPLNLPSLLGAPTSAAPTLGTIAGHPDPLSAVESWATSRMCATRIVVRPSGL